MQITKCICPGHRKGERHTNSECPAIRSPQPQPSYAERVEKNPDHARKSNASVRRIPHARLREAVDRVIKSRREDEGAALLETLFAGNGS